MMTKNKFLFFALSAFTIFGLTGCGEIKFIEKVSEETEDLGDITEIEDLGDITEVPDIEPTETETTEEIKNDNIIVVNNIEFEKKENVVQVFLKQDASILKQPKSDGEVAESLLKGEPLNLVASSKDNKWVMVRHFEGPITYVSAKFISYTYVRPDAVIIEKPNENTESSESKEDTKESTKPSESKSESKKPSTESSKPSESKKPSESTPPPSSQAPSESTPPASSQQPSTQPSSQPLGYLTAGIPYPENPMATSINLGVTFANVDIILRVTIDSTTANSGPGKATTSTGYEVRATFMAGDTVAVTGIGQNGYCRVELANGVIAFIDGTHLEYQ